MDAVIF